MKEKDVEKRLVTSLEEGGERSPRVLDAARAEMRRNKRSVWSRPAFRYALAGIVSVVICVAIVLPILYMHSSAATEVADFANDSAAYPEKQNASKPASLQTMYGYFAENGIEIKTFDRLNADTAESEGSSYVADDFSKETRDGEVAALSERYLYGSDEITVSVLLSSDEEIRQDLFGDFLTGGSVRAVAGTDVRYVFDETSGSGRATFVFRGRVFFVSISTTDEDAFFAHLQTFLAQ